MNPYNPATQFEQWLAWEKEHSGGAPKTETPKAEPPKASAPPASAPGVKPSLPGTASTPPAPTRSGSTYTPRPSVNYAEKNANEKAALQIAGGGFKDLPSGANMVNASGARAIYNGVIYTKDPTTNVWTTTGFAPSKTDVSGALAMKQQAGVQQQNTGLRNAIATSALPPEQRSSPTAIANSAGMMGTVGTQQGITVPGFEAYNRPGVGFASEGRTTLRDSGELNALYSNRPSGPQIQAVPAQRYGRSTGQTFGTGGVRVDPQMKFPGVAVSVPDTYVKGVGNTGDANRAIEVPFNIGPGGASSFTLAGSNVQMNTPDKGTGFGFALTPQTPSEKFAATDFGAATGRQLSSDPAINAAQTLSLIGAMNGGATIGALTEGNRGQYSGDPTIGQGTWFSGGAPGPQAAPVAAPSQDVSTAVNNALAALADQKDREEVGYADTPRFADGGNVIAMPRKARASRPFVSFADGGSVQTPNNPYTAKGPYDANAAAATAQTTQQDANTPPKDFDPLGKDILDPLVKARTQDAVQERNRRATEYQWGLAGRPAPTAIDVPLEYDTTGQVAPSGAYYSRTRAINDRINGITSLRDQLSGMGSMEDYEGTQGQIAALRQAQQPFKQAMGFQTQLQGLGTVEDAGAVNTRIAAIRQAMGPLGAIVDANQRLTELGPAYDQGAIGEATASIQALEGVIEAAGGENPYTPGTAQWYAQQQVIAYAQEQAAAAEAQLPQLKLQLSNMLERNKAIDAATNARNNLLDAAGLTWDQVTQQTGQYQTQLEAEKTALDRAMKAAELRSQIAALVGAGVDPTARYAELSGQIDPLEAAAAGILGRNTQRSQLGRQIYQMSRLKLPGFKSGGTVRTERDDEKDPLIITPHMGTIAGLLSQVEQARLDPRPNPTDDTQPRPYGSWDIVPNFSADLPPTLGFGNGSYNPQLTYAPGLWTPQPPVERPYLIDPNERYADPRDPIQEFKKGGTVTMPPKRAKKSMVTPEEIVGIGRKSGRPYFRVGEPRRPGGPPAPEKLTITPLPMGKRKVAA